jgi:hypothetical protein
MILHELIILLKVKNILDEERMEKEDCFDLPAKIAEPQVSQ